VRWDDRHLAGPSTLVNDPRMGAHLAERQPFGATDDSLCAASIALHDHEAGGASRAPALIENWLEVQTSGNPDSVRRYPWAISTLFHPLPAYVPPREAWRAWRPSEESERARDIGLFEARLLTPFVLSDAVELLSRLAESGDGDAATLLEQVLPIVRRDMARLVVGLHAWTDTWGLWNLARNDRALRRLHPFALAIADTYAARAIAQGGLGTGSRFPFHDQPLVSVSAQLAAGLSALGFHPQLTGRLAAWVAARETSEGAWGDADGPRDLLTTLVAADLLGGLDPAWDPGPAVAWVERQRRPDGVFVAYGPEAAWLTLELDALIARLALPFARRFRWPHLATEHRDRRTQLPFLGYLADLARLCAEVPALARAPVEIAFLDLAGFGAWNNRYGMAAGDEVLRFLAGELSDLPGSVAIRDGGDEFLVVGVPHGSGITASLDAFRHAFPGRLSARFGTEAVAPRILVGRTVGASLIGARDALGREIAELKAAHPYPPPEGILVPSAGVQLPGAS
jgi:GGDEF domain-containing protein